MALNSGKISSEMSFQHRRISEIVQKATLEYIFQFQRLPPNERFGAIVHHGIVEQELHIVKQLMGSVCFVRL